jgi:hypothetical protein
MIGSKIWTKVEVTHAPWNNASGAARNHAIFPWARLRQPVITLISMVRISRRQRVTHIRSTVAFQVRTSYDDLVRDTKDLIDWFHARQSRQKILCSIALDGPVALDTK